MNCTECSAQDVFGSNVFSDVTMRERLPKNAYKTFRLVQQGKAELDRATDDVIANAMKDWSIEKEAKHYCHWFQHMTVSTAEKHDSFSSPPADGRVMMEFSGKELTQG